MRFTEETYWKMQAHQDFYKILENNEWNKQHEEVHRYLIQVLNRLVGATSKESMESELEKLVEFRQNNGIDNTEEFEKITFDKYVKRYESDINI